MAEHEEWLYGAATALIKAGKFDAGEALYRMLGELRRPRA